MKKLDLKSVFIGVCIGSIGIVTAFAAEGLTAATADNVAVVLDGETVPLAEPLVSIVKEGEDAARMHMPLRELLEYLGYTVDWDEDASAVRLSSPESASAEAQTTQPMDSVMVNAEVNTELKAVAGDGAEHRIMLELVLECGTDGEAESIQANMEAVEGVITALLQEYTLDEVSERDFSDSLKEELFEALKELLTDVELRAIYFSQLYYM